MMKDEKNKQDVNINIGRDMQDANIIVGDNNKIFVGKTVKRRDLFTLLLIVAGILLGGVGAFWFSTQPRKMNGDFNIAIAKFGEIQSNGTIKASARSESISLAILNFLDSEFRSSNLNVTVSHKNMPLILEDYYAEVLAQKTNADIVIYGTITVLGDNAEFHPRFYVAEKPDANELTGQNDLGIPITFLISDDKVNQKITAEMQTRISILVNFTRSLVFISQNDYTSAKFAIMNAISEAKTANDINGQEVLYLISSIIKTQDKDFLGANSDLDTALSINPDYARAFLAKGNIYYIQSTENNFNAFYLENARHQYTQAFLAKDQPQAAYISEKAHVALGNVLVILAQQTNEHDLFDQAIDHYSYIIKQYNNTQNPALISNVSIAYFGLAVCYERKGELDKALEMYQEAHRLSNDEELKLRIENQMEIIARD